MTNIHQSWLRDVNQPDQREATASYRVHFLGPFLVVYDEQVIGEFGWRRSQSKTLLKWFLLHPNTRFSSEQLTELFWPHASCEVAMRNLHVAIHYLRQLLEPERQPHEKSHFIRHSKNHYYWLELDKNWWIDIFDIHRLLAEAKKYDQWDGYTRAIVCYRAIARQLEKGFLQEDIYEHIFNPFRREYEQIYIYSLERLIHIHQELSQYEEVIIYAQQALLSDPYLESAIHAMARSCVRQGLTTKSLNVLDDFHQQLKQELGIDPSPGFFTLRQRIIERKLPV